jgi:alpha-galactosidase
MKNIINPIHEYINILNKDNTNYKKLRFMKSMSFALIAFSLLLALNALDNGLGRVPPMGWNPWNKFGCNITEDLIK